MTESAVKRKSQLFLDSVIPVVNNYDEIVRNNLKTCKFPFTKTSVLKICSIVFLLTCTSLFLSSPICPNTPRWYPYLLPISTVATTLTATLLYCCLALGFAVNNPVMWVKLDIYLNFLLSVVTIVASVATILSCNSRYSLHNLPGPLGICGGALLIISCAGLFLLYRYREEEVQASTPIPESCSYRKSIHI